MDPQRRISFIRRCNRAPAKTQDIEECSHKHEYSPQEVIRDFMKELYRRAAANILTRKLLKTKDCIIYLQTTIKTVMFDKKEKAIQLKKNIDRFWYSCLHMIHEEKKPNKELVAFCQAMIKTP